MLFSCVYGYVCVFENGNIYIEAEKKKLKNRNQGYKTSSITIQVFSSKYYDEILINKII